MLLGITALFCCVETQSAKPLQNKFGIVEKIPKPEKMYNINGYRRYLQNQPQKETEHLRSLGWDFNLSVRYNITIIPIDTRYNAVNAYYMFLHKIFANNPQELPKVQNIYKQMLEHATNLSRSSTAASASCSSSATASAAQPVQQQPQYVMILPPLYTLSIVIPPSPNSNALMISSLTEKLYHEALKELNDEIASTMICLGDRISNRIRACDTQVDCQTLKQLGWKWNEESENNLDEVIKTNDEALIAFAQAIMSAYAPGIKTNQRSKDTKAILGYSIDTRREKYGREEMVALEDALKRICYPNALQTPERSEPQAPHISKSPFIIENPSGATASSSSNGSASTTGGSGSGSDKQEKTITEYATGQSGDKRKAITGPAAASTQPQASASSASSSSSEQTACEPSSKKQKQ